jgi:hypothetical protein
MARRAIVGLVLALVAAGAGLAAQAAGAPRLLPPPGPTCPAVLIMGARGSGQSAAGSDGMGPAVDRMAVDLRAWLAKTAAGTQTFGDPYPADSTNDLKPSTGELLLLLGDPIDAAIDYTRDNLDKFTHSIAVGTADAVGEADDESVDCPQTRLVMIGYSQGAMAMHQAELQLQAHHPAVFHKIVGTLLLADGDRVPNTRAREFGSSLARAEGIRPYLHAVAIRDVPLPGSTANICTAGDLICDFNLSRVRHFSQAARIHTGYAVQTSHGMHYSPLLDQAANWLGRKLALSLG